MVKSITEYYETDTRNDSFVIVDPETGAWRKMTLADHHQALSAVRLSPSVPEDVAAHFDAALQVLLYSWLAYEISAVAEQQVYSTIEFALKRRFNPQNRPGLKDLLARAVDEGLLRDEGFKENHLMGWKPMRDPKLPPLPPSHPARERCDALIEALPFLRNHLAHGANYVNTPGNVLATFRLARDLIDQLYAPKTETGTEGPPRDEAWHQLTD